MRRMLLLAGVALMLASGARAADKAELGCIAETYTAEQRGQIDALLPRVNLLSGGADPAVDELGIVIATTAAECSETFSWNEAQLETAFLYEFGRAAELAIRRHGPLSASDIAKVDAALGKGDRTTLWNALEAQVASGMAGDTETVEPGAALVFGAFMMETGVNLDGDMPEQVGAFLATKAMQRMSARDFSDQ